MNSSLKSALAEPIGTFTLVFIVGPLLGGGVAALLYDRVFRG